MKFLGTLAKLLKLIKAGGHTAIEVNGGFFKTIDDLLVANPKFLSAHFDDFLSSMRSTRGAWGDASAGKLLDDFLFRAKQANLPDMPELFMSSKTALGLLAGGIGLGAGATGGYFAHQRFFTPEEETSGTEPDAIPPPSWASEESFVSGFRDLTAYGRSTSGDDMYIEAVVGGGDHILKYGIVGEEAKHPGRSLDGAFHIVGTANNDRIRASDGATDDNIFFGEGGDDWLAGGRGRDMLDGGNGSDVLEGGREDDILLGGNGNDRLVGGDGDDILTGGAGADTIEGGVGDDLVDYSTSDGGVTVDLVGRTGHGGEAEGDRLYDVEHILGSDHDDRLLGDDATNNLNGGAGHDELDGRGGNDLLYGEDGHDAIRGGAGTDLIDGGNGVDFLDGGEGSDVLSGGEGSDELHGGAGGDLLVGDAGADWLDGGEGEDTVSYLGSAGGVRVDLASRGVGSGSDAEGDVLIGIEHLIGSSFADELDGDHRGNLLDGNAGNDRLFGREGDDVLAGGAGADLIDGGAGIDTADYSDSRTAVQIDLAVGSAAWGDAEGDQFVGIENVIGSRGADFLFGDDRENLMATGAGGDTVDGRGGNDVLSGGVGGDTVRGGAGEDTLYGDEGTDVLYGGDGNDTLMGGNGADRLHGDAGVDWADYSETEAGVAASLINGLVWEDGKQTDWLIDIENLRGSAHDDELHGNGLANVLDGGNGNDILNGGAGADRLVGGKGSDTLLGGTGADVLDGGSGNDTADYSASAGNLAIRMDGVSSGHIAEGDTLIDIENVIAGNGHDLIVGTALDNRIEGRSGNDEIYAGDGIDAVEGGDGADYIDGGNGSDALFGGASDDRVLGGAGDDRVDGGSGWDRLWGGEGRDAFAFVGGWGDDHILDFEDGIDRIHIDAGAFARLDAVLAGAIEGDVGLRLDFGDGRMITLEGVDRSTIGREDFVVAA